MDSWDISDGDIAIIGMSGRFPGARNIREYWQKLRDGVECIIPLSEEQMRSALLKSLGYVPEATLAQWLRDPHYVRAAAVLEDIDLFDAEFFGYTTSEAEAMDPQQRLFLECAWEVMEDAGYDPHSYEGLIGVYAGAEMSSYHHQMQTCLLPTERDFLALLGNEADYLTTRVSYKLDCKGPSFNIQSACSTSLVAVHVACQSLKSGECDMALAGGVVAYATQEIGYVYREGGLVSPDGHCRPFDARAGGTVLAHGGVGAVLLKPLREAVADGDNIYAVIKGSAVNNDGLMKTGYTAPGISGQARVVTEALAVADIPPDSISYIEAHGSATPLGDSVEITALTQAFRRHTKRKNFCALGSVRSNIGHLGAASGIAALIKTVLALHHKKIPPSLHYEHPHPQIDVENSPFYVNSMLREWVAAETPRRAGVNSLGIGGSNAHIILEEAPPLGRDEVEASQAPQLLVLSARTEAALEQMTVNLRTHLEDHPEQDLADVAYTLQVGRRAFAYRRVIAGRSHGEVIRAMRTMDASRVFSAYQENMQAGSYQHIDLGHVPDAQARLWLAGRPVEWSQLYERERRRLSLPTYPFERHRYWMYPPQIGYGADVGQQLDATRDNYPVASAAVSGPRPRPELSVAYVAPRNEIEQVLARTWQELFGIERIGVLDSYYDLGGHSLLAMRMAERVRTAFSIDIALVRFFELRTIAELADLVEEMLIKKVEDLSEEEVQRLI
jgi:acyl transferase domain-containing protein